jgi:hypothetical protein
MILPEHAAEVKPGKRTFRDDLMDEWLGEILSVREGVRSLRPSGRACSIFAREQPATLSAAPIRGTCP